MVELSWSDDSKNEEGFKVYRSLDVNPADFKEIATVDQSVTSFSDYTISPETAYLYKVSAFNAGGESDSNILSVQTLATPTAPTAPNAPTNLSQVSNLWN